MKHEPAAARESQGINWSEIHQRVETARERVHALANRLSFIEQDREDGAA